MQDNEGDSNQIITDTGVNLTETDLVFSGVTIKSAVNDVACDYINNGKKIVIK